MPNCASLQKQRTEVDGELTKVTAIVNDPPSPGVLAQMAQRQAELREQLSTLDTLINQSCPEAAPAGAAAMVAPAAPAPPLIRAAEKEHEKALRTLTAATIKLSKLSRKDAERQMKAKAKGAA